MTAYRIGQSALPGTSYPLGATVRADGTNFAVTSSTADSMKLCLFDAAGGETRVPLVDYDAGVWHAFVPGVGVGQKYGYRAGGTYDPDSGLRFNSEKLLLDPYARALVGEVSYGPEVLGYAADNPDAPSPLDSAGHVPRSIVLDDAYEWRGERPSHRYADTVIYEVHVKGFRRAIRMCRPSYVAPMPGWATRRPSTIYSNWVSLRSSCSQYTRVCRKASWYSGV